MYIGGYYQQEAGGPVAVGFLLTRQALANPFNMGLKGDQLDLIIDFLCLIRMGDALDEGDYPTASGSSRVTLECLSSWFRSHAAREPFSDSELRKYVAAKVWWADRLGETVASFHWPDEARAGVALQRVRSIAREEDDEYWRVVVDGPSLFTLRSLPTLLKAWRRSPGMGTEGDLVLDIQSELGGARLATPRRLLDKALRAYRQADPDYENAAKDAVLAVESLARELTGESTLGRALPKIRAKWGVEPQLIAAIENLSAASNAIPNVRHGKMSDARLKAAEAQLILNWAVATVLLLLQLEPHPPSRP